MQDSGSEAVYIIICFYKINAWLSWKHFNDNFDKNIAITLDKTKGL